MKHSILLVPALLFALLTACNPGSSGPQDAEASLPPLPSAPSVDASEIFLTFIEAVESSNCGAVGEFVRQTELSRGIQYEFLVKEVLRGDIPEEMILLNSSKELSAVMETGYTYELGKEGKYTVGEEYILILQRVDSLFIDHPVCVLPTDIFIPAKDIGSGTMYGKPISDSYQGDILTLLKETKLGPNEYVEFTRAEDMPTIVAEASHIMEVKVDYLPSEAGPAAARYDCVPLNILKGDKVELRDGGYIWISLMKESLKLGETYIILVNRVGDNRTMYSQSSTKSIFPLSDTEAIQEIKDLLARDDLG